MSCSTYSIWYNCHLDNVLWFQSSATLMSSDSCFISKEPPLLLPSTVVVVDVKLSTLFGRPLLFKNIIPLCPAPRGADDVLRLLYLFSVDCQRLFSSLILLARPLEEEELECRTENKDASNKMHSHQLWWVVHTFTKFMKKLKSRCRTFVRKKAKEHSENCAIMNLDKCVFMPSLWFWFSTQHIFGVALLAAYNKQALCV